MKVIKNTCVLGLLLPTIIKANNGISTRIPGCRSNGEIDIKDGTEVTIKQGFTFSSIKVDTDNDSVLIISASRVLNILFVLGWLAFIVLCFFGPSSIVNLGYRLTAYKLYAVLIFPILFLISLVYYSFIAPSKAIKVTRIK